MQPRACEPTYMVHHLGAGQTDRQTLLQFDFGEVFMGLYLPLTHLYVMMIVLLMMMFAVPGLVYY